MCAPVERKITALKIQKRNPNRVNVYLDGEFAFGLARIVAAWLSVGQTLDEAKITQLQGQEAQEKACLAACRLLQHRLRSTAEIRTRLEQKGFDVAVIRIALDRLAAEGVLADERFARSYIESRMAFRPRSQRLLQRELRQKGVAEEIITQTLEEHPSADDELAYQAAVRYSRRLAGTAWQTFRQRLGGFLARRGFSYAVCAPVIHRIWTEMNSPGEVASESMENKESR